MSAPPPKDSRRALAESVGSRGAALALGFLAQFFAAKFLGVSGNGQFGAAVTLANGLGVVASWGLASVLLNRALPLGREGRLRLRRNSFRIRCALGLAAGLLGAGIWTGWSEGWSEPLALLLLVAFSAHDNLWQFQVCGRTSQAYHLMALQALLNAAGLACLALMPHPHVWFALCVQALSCAAARSLGHLWLGRSYEGAGVSDAPAPGVRELILATRWNVVAGLVGFGAGFSDTLVCRIVLDESETGLLRCAQMALIAPLALIQATTALAQARWSQLRLAEGPAAAARKAQQETRRLALAAMAACPAFAVLAWFGLPWVMGAAYAPAGPLLAVWVFVLPLGVAGMMLQAAQQVMEQFPFLLRLNLLNCLISIGLNVSLMPLYGVWVAIFTNILVNIVAVLFSSRHLARLEAR